MLVNPRNLNLLIAFSLLPPIIKYFSVYVVPGTLETLESSGEYDKVLILFDFTPQCKSWTYPKDLKSDLETFHPRGICWHPDKWRGEQAIIFP